MTRRNLHGLLGLLAPYVDRLRQGLPTSRGGVIRALVVVLALALVTISLKTVLGLRDARRSVLDSMRNELLAIARTTALEIEAAGHERVHGPQGSKAPDFGRLREALRSAREANGLSTEVYTLRPAGDSMEFVIMTNSTPFVGSRCAMRPEMTVALSEKRAAVTDLYSNANGSWISAFAPIIDASGRAIALLAVDRTADEFVTELRRRARGVGAFAAIGITVAVLLTITLYFWLVRPLRRLVFDVRRLASGDCSLPVVRVTGEDEVGRLGAEFRHLVGELDSSRETLEHQRHRLARQNHRLRRANRTKDRFLSMMSHEMRTPLNGVIGFIDLTLQGFARSREEECEFLKSARESASRLLRLVETTLDLSRIETGALQVSTTRTDLAAILVDEARNVLQLARAKGVRLGLSFPADGLPTVLADGARLRQVVSALLDDALKLAESGEISIEATVVGDGQTVRATLSDSGDAASTGWENRVFDKFTQSDASRGRRSVAAGVGLTLARGLIEAMGGRIQLLDEAGRGGSNVRFDIPVASDSPPPREAVGPPDEEGVGAGA